MTKKQVKLIVSEEVARLGQGVIEMVNDGSRTLDQQWPYIQLLESLQEKLLKRIDEA